VSSLRLGIVGAGSIVARKHLLALAEVPEIAVAAVCRRDAGALHALADRFRIPGRYTDYRALLDEPGIDAVLVATGPAAQPEVVMAAVAAGKHVLAEKPMAETSDQARAMAAAIRRAGVHFQVGFNKRCYYGYRTARQLVGSGVLGTPTGMHARFWFQPGRADPLLHNGIHFLDLARFLVGPIREVFARRVAPAPGGAAGADTWAVSLEFDGGAVGNLLVSSLASWDYVNEHLDLVGSNHAVVSVDNGRVVRVSRRGDGNRAEVRENTLSAHWWSGNEEQGFTGQLRIFAGAVLGGPRAAPASEDPGGPAAGPEDGVRALEVLEAVRESAATGRTVSLAARGAESLAPRQRQPAAEEVGS
jgi:myo-inositol 2-dehydrogenase/D-chiro-inositol 1-dehydrogenase